LRTLQKDKEKSGRERQLPQVD